jgi:hypothetical protein
MNEAAYLSAAELRRLTGSVWKSRQKKRLEEMGYPFELSYDGLPLVSRWFAEQKAQGHDVTTPTGPRLDLVT